MKKLTKPEAEREIKEFFKNLKDREPRELKKIKRLAMKHNIKLGALKKRFCRKCYSINLAVKRIKGKIKVIECKNCGSISRWKLK